MTSEQVMRYAWAALLAWAAAVSAGCTGWPSRDPALVAPYGERQLWAVAPLANESGSLQADGVRLADQLARTLENAGGLDVVPVSRVLAAMQSLELDAVRSPADAASLRGVLGADALVLGTVSAYEPYDPPKVGLAVELYLDPHRPRPGGVDLRELSRAATEEMSRPEGLGWSDPAQPASVISRYFDAADPQTREALERYARRRGGDRPADRHAWRLYRISMDLYTEFVSHEVSSRLLDAERTRLTPPEPDAEPNLTTPPAS